MSIHRPVGQTLINVFVLTRNTAGPILECVVLTLAQTGTNPPQLLGLDQHKQI